MIVYKLTRKDRTTHGGFKWPRKGFSPPELGGKDGLCSGSWYHAYEHPLLAVLHAPIHVNPDYTRLFKVEVTGKIKREGYMKLGFTAGILGKEVKLPEVTTEQRVRYAIGCACSVHDNKDYRHWADDWISGKNRSAAAGEAAAAWAAEAAAAWAAERAAWAAARALAARAAERAAWPAWAAAWAAEAAAAWAAERAAWAARAAARAWDINLIHVAEWAMTDEPLSTLLD